MKSEKNKKVSKKLQSFIDSIAYIDKSTIPGDDGLVYYSKIDGAYPTRVDMEGDLSFLLKTVYIFRTITKNFLKSYNLKQIY